MPMIEFGNDENNPSPVVALSLFDAATTPEGKILPESQLLVVVRDKETNLKHPNVVSVPTQRIPLTLQHALLDQAPIMRQENSLTYYSPELIDSARTSGHDPRIYIVESLLARKLGLADALECNEFTFRVSLRLKKVGRSLHPNLPVGQGQTEHITMINLMVLIDAGKELIPARTPSYSHIMWSGAESFTHAVREKNPLQFDNALDPIEYCIHGLCISSTYSVIAGEFGIDPTLEFFV